MVETEREKNLSDGLTTEPQALLIFPCNGNAIETLDCLGSTFQFEGFIDDTPAKQRDGAFGHPVLPRAVIAERSTCQILAVPGSPSSYKDRTSLIQSLGIDVQRFAQVFHPSAQISLNATIGYNVVAMAGVVVTSNARIGNHVCLLPNAVVHHDSTVGDWSMVGTNVAIAGGVDIGNNCFIGSGSSIKNGVRIGDGAMVGIGSTVIKHVPSNAVVVGNPARILRHTHVSEDSM